MTRRIIACNFEAMCHIPESSEESAQGILESSLDPAWRQEGCSLFPFSLNRAGSKPWSNFAHRFVLECFWNVKRFLTSHHGN